MARKDDLLREHDLAGKLAKHSRAGGTMRLKGYVGSSDSPDSICLYLNLNFDECLYIKKDDIIHVEEAPEGELEYGGTYIWVSKDAEITHVKTASVKEKASFLEGEIAKAQLKPSERQAELRVGIGKRSQMIGDLHVSVDLHCGPASVAGCFTKPFICEKSVEICPTRQCSIGCPVSEHRWCDPGTGNFWCPTDWACQTGPQTCIEPVDLQKEIRTEMEKLKTRVRKLEEEKK